MKTFRFQHATVDRWLDGDTVALTIDLGFRLSFRLLVRLEGVNAPEIGTTEGVVSHTHATEIAPPGTEVEVETVRGASPYRDRITWDRYVGRVFAQITPSGSGPGPLQDVGRALIAGGWAKEAKK